MQLDQHLAVVMTNNNDPDKEFGIEVQIDTLLPGEIYPVIVKPFFPINQAAVPEVGQTIKVLLIANDEGDPQNSNYGGIDFPDFIYYDHRIFDVKKGKIPSVLKQNYPKRCGWWQENGNIIYMDQTKNSEEITIRLKGGTSYIQITGSKIVINGNTYLGSSSGTEALLKGNTVYDAFDALVNGGGAGWQSLALAASAAPDPTGVAFQTYAGSLNTLLIAFAATLAGFKSTKHFLDS